VRKLLHKITHWEYWPFSFLYIPAYFYYIWLVLKHRSFFFFTASNPAIEFGGMFGEKKSDIFQIIPDGLIPKTRLIFKGDVERAAYEAEEIGFPVIAKPDIGERGVWVETIEDQRQLAIYVDKCPVNFLIQELIDFQLELGVFYVKKPKKPGRITSIVRKEFLHVIGDGNQTVMELLEQNDRALLTFDLDQAYIHKIGNSIPRNGEKVLIEPIGNHSRGTKFLDDCQYIDEELNQAFQKIVDQIPGFYFGRFDIRCKSYDDLKKLKNFKILELNGAGSEPGHIYQPGFPLWNAYRAIFWHLSLLSDISAENRKKGHSYWSFKQGFKMWKRHQRYNRLLQST